MLQHINVVICDHNGFATSGIYCETGREWDPTSGSSPHLAEIDYREGDK
jgi:hypothetical protein